MPIAGIVVFEGAPLEKGTITLTNSVAGLSAEIQQGAFSSGPDLGLPTGTYQVQVLSFVPTGREIADSDWPGKTVQETRQLIPAKYNERSTLTIDESAENSSNLQIKLDGK